MHRHRQGGGGERWHPGQLLFVGFAGHELPRDLAELISAGRVGGVVLFRRNVGSPSQLRALVDRCHELAPAGAPLTIAIDQEGGRVLRLREPWTQWPAMARVGALDDLDATGALARSIATELADLAIDVDFAPVVDVDSNRDNPIIGDRSFAHEPRQVARHALAFVEAMQAAGVAACVKHFPGHGDTTTDSHLELPRIDHDLDRLERVELVPFRAAAGAGVASIMSAHVLFPRLDPRRPATLSPDVMALLRDQIGYDGLVFSDDLEMKAVADHFSCEERSLGALRAGVDALLVCSQADLRDEILAQLERAPDACIEHALRRMVAFKARHAGGRCRSREAAPPYPEHQALCARFT